MLKSLAIVAAVILGLTVYVAIQNQRAAEQAINKTTQTPKAVAPSLDHEKPQENTENSQGNSPGWYGFFTWPNSTTTWAILLTLVAIVWQSSETKNAAQAALLNAQALINAERPWLVFNIGPLEGPKGGFEIRARNKGRTPAMIVAAQIGCVAVKDVSALPAEPPYGVGKLIKDRILVADDTVWVIWFDRRMIKNMLGDQFPEDNFGNQIFLFGRLLYRDLLDPTSASTHETRWICIYQLNDEGDYIYHIEGLGLPGGYEKYT